MSLRISGKWRGKMGGKTYDAGGGIDGAGKGVDGYHVCGLVVPWTVFTPVGGGDFLPGVVEDAIGAEDFHGGRVSEMTSRGCGNPF